MKLRILEIYRSGKQWRWRMLAANGKKQCTPGESYKRREGCLMNLVGVTDVQFEIGDTETNPTLGRHFKLQWGPGTLKFGEFQHRTPPNINVSRSLPPYPYRKPSRKPKTK